MSEPTLADVLEAYGQLIREDWSEIDGRTVLTIMNGFADLYRREKAGEDISVAIQHELADIEEQREARGW